MLPILGLQDWRIWQGLQYRDSLRKQCLCQPV